MSSPAVGFGLSTMGATRSRPFHPLQSVLGATARGNPETPAERAADDRAAAADACGKRRWDECEAALNRAARLDAQGDGVAEVKALREAIAAGRRGTEGGTGER